jgi:hypothetical protein
MIIEGAPEALGSFGGQAAHLHGPKVLLFDDYSGSPFGNVPSLPTNHT